MTTKHTPGPWRVDGGKLEGLTVRAGAMAIATIPGYGVGVRNDNARLIAAAPELLEALKFVMSAHGEQLESAFAQAHEAITKAEGR